MATLIAPFTPVDGNGHVMANARLYLYQTGTSTLQNSFSDAALSVTNTNPVVADSNGLFAGIYLGDAPTFEAYKAILKTSGDVTVWTQDPFAGAPITPPLSAALLRGYLSGLQRTANTTTTIAYGAGVCADDTSTSMLSLSAGTINAATVGADGLDAGALANNTWYHVFAIGKTDGTVARLASTSVSSPTMPSGYTLKRRIGGFRTNGSAQIINFTQVGDEFIWSATVSGVRDVAIGVPPTTVTLSDGVPTGLQVRAKIRVRGFGGNGGALLYPPDQVTQALDVPSGNQTLAWTGSAQSGTDLTIRTNTAAQVIAVSVSAGALLNVAIYGWEDRRGRDD